IGDALHCRADWQIRVASQIRSGYHLFADVVFIADGELMAPCIEGLAELTAARPILELACVRTKANNAARGLERWRVGIIGEVKIASPVAELLREDNRGRRTFVCEIDPVIETVDWVVDRVLRIGDGESGQYYSPSVRLAVAVGIFQVDDIGRIGDQHP